MEELNSRIELIGSMYDGKIKNSNETRGVLVFENGWLAFWPLDSNQAMFKKESTGVSKVILMPSGINFHIGDKKFAFIPDQTRGDGFSMGLFSAKWDMLELLRQSRTDLPKLVTALSNNDYVVEKRGLDSHIHLSLILFGVIIGGSLLITIIYRLISWLV